MSINFNINPYYDDFDETKNYHRILFKPGYAVQARELTQLQTQLQDQINKFGKHVFVNGTVVLGGGRLFDNQLISIKLNSSYLGNTVDILDFENQIIVGSSSGTKAVVKAICPVTSTDPMTLLVKIISGGPQGDLGALGATGANLGFQAGENISTVVGSYDATIQSSLPFNAAMAFSIDSGIFFVDGKFVYLEPQSIPISKYDNTSSYNIGLVLNEEIIDAETTEAASLLDRAQDSPNYAAPGADRYRASLTLTVKPITPLGATGVTVENFIEIARVVNGQLVTNANKTIYSEIGKELARRTFDESGDYTVKNWPLQILNHVPAAGATGPDSSKFTIALDPGKAYVKGYEFETINQTFLEFDRARDYEQVENQDVTTSYGSYLHVANVFGEFRGNSSADAYTPVELHSVGATGVTSATTKLGTAKVRGIQHILGPRESSPYSKYRMYLYDIQILNGATGINFKNVESIIVHGATGTGPSYRVASANIDGLSKIGGASSADTFLSGSDSPGLVFPVPNQYIKTIRGASGVVNTDYMYHKAYFNVQFNNGAADIYTADGKERFVGGVGSINDTNKGTYYHVVFTDIDPNGNDAGQTGYTTGSIANFDDAESRTITLQTPLAETAQKASFDLNDNQFNGFATIIATITANKQTEKSKSFTTGPYRKVVLGPGLNTIQGGKDSLQASDIYDIKAIYNIGSNNGATVDITPTTGVVPDAEWAGVSTHTDVTDNYILDNGQRSEFYDWGNIILNGTAPGGSDHLLVIYRNFAHSGTGYCSVDSYTGTIEYQDIPSFTDPATGVVYNLRDCIDFRPRRTDGASSITGQVPVPYGTMNASYQYYLSRIDKLIATSDKQFAIKKGIPAVYPTIPTDESNGMSIYNVVIPAYTADIRDVQIKYIENRRYTMRDIGRLEKRIGNLEYYTQLSLLEKQAKDTSIPDSSNFEKFKNGFAVDPFTSADVFASSPTAWSTRRWGWWNAWFNGANNWNGNYNENSIANASDANFSAAIDPINQELRAPFEVDFNLFDTSTLSNTKKDGDLVTLDYTEVTAIDQPVSSTYININPFNVIRFVGSIVLEPAFDQWVDTQYLPAVNQIVDIQLQDAADRTVTVATGGHGPAFRVTGTSTTTTTNVVGSTTTSLGTNVVDIQYVPFIRANTILGVSKLFKPRARLYPFIENTSIAQYVKPLTVVEVQHVSGALFDDKQGVHESLSFRTGSQTGTQTGTAKTAIYSQPITDSDPPKRLLTIYDNAGVIAVGKYVVGLTGNGYGIVTAVSSAASFGDALVPDEYGNVAFEFHMPANTFKTGERTIRLIDNSSNDTEAQESIGETKYTAIGTLQTKQETILTTRSLQNQKTITTVGYWYDPLGQTFLVDPAANPQGFHLSSVDLYFKSKSATVPVTLEIRRTVNGYPESVRTIPFSESILFPENVNIQGGGTSSTSDAVQPATTFQFANPIHLTPGEYALVLVSQCDEYQVYISDVGGKIFGGTTKVDKQPYMGSLFKSQNASTWEPDQNKDLKFKIKRADFVSSGTAEFTIQDPTAIFDYNTLFTNVSTVLPTGTNVVWSAKGYNTSSSPDLDWIKFNVLQDINYSLLKRLAAASVFAGEPSLKLKATLTTDNSFVSPVIDAASLAVVTTLNTINDDATNEGSSVGGEALAKYITKPINLAAGFEATNICVTVDINKPPGTDVKVYFRCLATEQNTPIATQNWELMEIENARIVPSSLSNYDYKEHRFFPINAFDDYGVPYDAPITPRFNSFQIKIVMLSNTKAQTPKLKDLRIIALDS